MINENKRADILAYLMNELSVEQKTAFEKELNDNQTLKEEFESLQLIWNTADVWKDENPSEQMDNRFFDMLDNEIEKNNQKVNILSQIESWLSGFFTKQMIYRLTFLAVGVGFGFWLNTNTNEAQSNELTTVRQDLVLTLLEQPAANKRLQAVSEVSRFTEVDEKVVTALLKTLNNDSNDNVRIAAIESLVQFADNPMVRKGLIESISYQTSPLVQISLANTMVILQEKNAKKPLQELLEKEETDATVKERLERSIDQII